MPLDLLSVEKFFVDPLVLTKTTRPYFLQSCALVLSCRRLPEPPSGAAAQIKDLQKLFKEVKHVLYLGTIAPRNHQTETNEAFRAADEYLRDYIAKYNVTLALAPDTDEVEGQVIPPWKDVSKKDRIAGSWIKRIKEKRKPLGDTESMKHIATLTLNISLWPEKPRKRENGEWLYASKNFDVEIENFASLNFLLHRLFWAKAMGNALDSFSLKQNPQFYTKFPYRKDDFPMQFQVSKSRSGVAPHIPALYMWDPVERYKGGTLHLIVDRDRSRRVVELEDLTKLYLPKIYGNGWYLEDDKDFIAVREKGRSHSLLLLNVKQPPVPFLDSTTVTLVQVPGPVPRLCLEELNEEPGFFAASTEPIPAVSQSLPRQRSFVKDRTPLPHSPLNVHQPNTSKSRSSQVLTKNFLSNPNSSSWKVPSSTPTNSWTGQKLSFSSAHQKAQSSTQARNMGRPRLQPLQKISDLIDGRHTERDLSPVDQNVTQPIVNRSSVEESEHNIASGSQHGNRTPSMRDLSEPRKKKAVLEDKAGEAIKELLELRTQELRDKTIQDNFYSLPQHGAGSFAQPHTNPTPDASRSSPLPLEYTILSVPHPTGVYHHHHFYYNSPCVSPSPLPVINNRNIVRINNSNTSDSSESRDDEESKADQNS